MPWETIRGQKLWIDPETGKAQLRSGDQVVETDPESAAKLVEQGKYTQATPEDAERYDYRQNRTVGQDIRDATITGGRKTFDIFTAPGRIAARGIQYGAEAVGAKGVASEAQFAAESMGGRAVQALAAEEGAMSRGEDPDKARKALEETQRRFAEDRPGAYLASSVAPEIAASLAMPQAVGVRGLALQGAVEGAGFGALQAEENAFITGDDDLSAEDWLATIGLGIGLGAAAGAGAGAASEGLGRILGRGSKTAGANLDEAAVRAERSAYRQAQNVTGDQLAESFSKVTGESIFPEVAVEFYNRNIAPLIGKGSELASGADSKFVSKALSATDEGRVIREVARNPDAVLDDAVGTVLRAGNKYEKAMGEITEVSRDMEMKASAWNKLVDPDRVDGAIQLSRRQGAQALGELDSIEGRIIADDMLESTDRKVLKRVIRDARNNFQRAAHGTETAGDAMAALDIGKRHLQNHIKRLRTDAKTLYTRAGDSGRSLVKSEVAEMLQGVQESTRTFLENSDVWGKAGEAQKRINLAWTEKLDPHAEANHGWSQMRRRIGGSDYEGNAVYKLDENAVQSFIGRIGRKAGGQEYFQMVRQLKADEDLVEAIGLSLGKESPAYRAFAEAHKEMVDTIERVKVRGGYANQLKLLQQASGSGVGNLGAAGVGYAVGGAPGAAVLGLLSNPAHLVRAASAVAAMGERVNQTLNGHVGRMFARAAGKVRAPRLPGQVAIAGKAVSKAAKHAAVPAGIRVFSGKFKDRQDAYRARAAEIVELTSNTAMRHQRFAALGRGAPTAGIAAQMTMKQAQGLAFLLAKMPAPLTRPGSLMPHLDHLPVSDSDLDTFSRYWSAVREPFSVLEDLERGCATKEQVEALRTVYPRLYQRVRMKVLEHLAQAKKRPPFELLKQLDTLLELNGQAEPSMSPEFIQRQQQRMMEFRQKQPPQGRPQHATPHLSDRYESELSFDELESAR